VLQFIWKKASSWKIGAGQGVFCTKVIDCFVCLASFNNDIACPAPSAAEKCQTMTRGEKKIASQPYLKRIYGHFWAKIEFVLVLRCGN